MTHDGLAASAMSDGWQPPPKYEQVAPLSARPSNDADGGVGVRALDAARASDCTAGRTTSDFGAASLVFAASLAAANCAGGRCPRYGNSCCWLSWEPVDAGTSLMLRTLTRATVLCWTA